MRLKGVHVPLRSIAGKTSARARWLPLISGLTAGAFGFGYVVTLAAHGATAVAAGGEASGGSKAAGARPVISASPAVAAVGTGVVDPAVKPYLNPKLLKEVPVGPGAVSKPVRILLTSTQMTTALDASGIPEVALEAYQRAAADLAVSDAACHLPWQLLAAIGRVESDNGQFGGAMLLPNGNTSIPIYGIPLDGRAGVALVRDTNPNDVKLDGDPNFARAVGPMQFLPSTWDLYGADGNGDGKKDVNNIFDASLGAADYLCAGGGDMANPAQEAAAVLRYNDADEYVHVVLALAASYSRGDFATVPTAVPVGTGGGATASSTKAPVQTPTPQPTTPQPTTSSSTAPSSTATGAVPSASPTATPTESPSPSATATPAPTDTTESGPTPSGQPSQGPVASATPSLHAAQYADIGWAPAMRQVVVKLLTTPTAAPAQPIAPTPSGPQPTETSTSPARRPTATNHG